MSLFVVSKYVHILLGFLALMGFWGAALKTKGSTRHKWFGRRYLIVMAMLLATTQRQRVSRHRVQGAVCGA